jgi:putative DNA primase/helicase
MATCRIAWEPDVVTITADEVVAAHTAHAPLRPRDRAAEWLRDLLAGGPMPQQKIKLRAREARFSWATVRRAAKDIGVITEKTGYAAGWTWRI